MKLLILANAEVIHTHRWVSYFREHGHEVVLATLEPSGDGVVEGEHLLPSYFAVDGLKYPAAAFPLARLIREFKPDLVNAHFVPGYGFMASLTTSARPLAVSAWGSDLLLNPEKSLFHRYRAWFVLRCAGLVSCDGTVLRNALMKLGVEESRILEVPMGVDTLLFYSERRKNPTVLRPAIGDRPFRIISTRSLEPLYDLDTLLRAAVILREGGWNFAVDVVGEGSARESLEAFQDEYSLKERVIFWGRLTHSEVAQALRRAGIYVSTSLSDSTSVSLLEAMASGIFPVVTDIEGNRQWIENGENGLLFPPGDFGRLSECLAWTFLDDKLRKKARRKNLELIKSKAIWQDNMKVVEERFLALIKK